MKNYADLNRQERIQKAFDLRKIDLCLVLENLKEETNIAAILRSAEAFGVGKVYIIHEEGSKPKVNRGPAKGASLWLEIEYLTSVKDLCLKLKKDGFKLIGALVDPKAKVLWKENFSGKVAVFVGNEANGLSKEVQDLVDENIYLPMIGLTESLNVSVATGIFLYEVIRQKEYNT